MQGTLFIVATPIGNMADITLRAIETLRSVDIIACEDTRHTRKLASFYKIDTPLISYFEHNKIKRAAYIVNQLKQGKSVALVSDAGTPGISDPGYRVIKQAIDNNIPVSVIPGANAIITALVASGLPTDRFVFEGFLTRKPIARRKRLKAFLDEKRTVIFYESCHRTLKTLSDVLDIFGDIKIVVARELTKKFEEIQRGRISAIISHLKSTKPKGEFIILINPKTKNNGAG